MNQRSVKKKYKKRSESLINNIIPSKTFKKTSKILIFSLLFLFILVTNHRKFKNIINVFSVANDYIYDKWIVLTTINPPNETIFSLLKFLDNWKIVVVADKKTIDGEWIQFSNSSQLIYLSLENQYNF